jgi:AraC-like DNA-binding protein
MSKVLYDIQTEEIFPRNNIMLTEKFSFSMSLFIKDTTWIKSGQPYLYNYTHLLHIIGGIAHYNINLKEYTFKEGDIVIIAKNSILEMIDFSENYQIQVVSIKDEDMQAPYCLQVHANEKENNIIEKYFDVINVSIQQKYNDNIINHLTSALKEEFYILYKEQENIESTSNNRIHDLFNRFLSLVSQYSSNERNIKFYADKLYISPHYLSTIIKQVSGKSLMYWVNASVINKAKIALQYTDKSIIEISQDLNFNEHTTFTRFFKHITGITPTEYRK